LVDDRELLSPSAILKQGGIVSVLLFIAEGNPGP
jgi:hypothetical protein